MSIVVGPAVLMLSLIFDTPETTYSKWPMFFPAIMGLIQKYSLAIWLIVGSLALFSSLTRFLGSPWIGAKLQYILDAMQKEAYPDYQSDANHYHRVTLFKYKKCVLWMKKPGSNFFWPWGKGNNPFSGWLVPVIRSGHTTQNTKAAFVAPDNADRAEGVAGQAWVSNATTIRDELPEIHSTSSPSNISKYAERTFCLESHVNCYKEAGKSLPRSIGAIPLLVNGRPWGVLVLDSRAPKGVTEERVQQLTLTADVVSQLLEKA